MANIRPYLLAAGIAAAALVGANGVAVAATGHALILGHDNYANRTTAIHRTTSGAPLSLYSHSGAPLWVNRSTKVTRLNADYVDGKNASQLQTNAVRYSPPTAPASTIADIAFPNLAHGIYLVSYSLTTQMSTSGASMDCAFYNNTSNQYELADHATNTGLFATINGGGVLDARTATFTFRCFGSSNFTYVTSQPNYSAVTFVRIDGLSTRSGLTPTVAHAAPAHRTAH